MIAYQLYSSRNFKPWRGVFEQLAAIGIRYVEGFGDLYANSEDTRAALDDCGLQMRSGHIALHTLEQEPQQVLELAGRLGMSELYCPYLAPEERPNDSSGYQALATRLARAGDIVVDAGLRFGWHNHDFEFVALPDGSLPIEHLLGVAEHISWEIDVAWIVRAGADPTGWIERYRDRIASIHVKDLARPGNNVDEDGWADLGDGVVDWAALVQQIGAGSHIGWVLEHDNPSDHLRFASRSLERLQNLGVDNA